MGAAAWTRRGKLLPGIPTVDYLILVATGNSIFLTSSQPEHTTQCTILVLMKLSSYSKGYEFTALTFRCNESLPYNKAGPRRRTRALLQLEVPPACRRPRTAVDETLGKRCAYTLSHTHGLSRRRLPCGPRAVQDVRAQQPGHVCAKRP